MAYANFRHQLVFTCKCLPHASPVQAPTKTSLAGNLEEKLTQADTHAEHLVEATLHAVTTDAA